MLWNKMCVYGPYSFQLYFLSSCTHYSCVCVCVRDCLSVAHILFNYIYYHFMHSLFLSKFFLITFFINGLHKGLPSEYPNPNARGWKSRYFFKQEMFSTLTWNNV